MRDNDAIIALLTDLKDLLYGIALLLLAGILCLVGALLLDTWGALLLGIGIFVGLAGLLYARHGLHHHETVEHGDQSPGTPNS